MTGSSLESILSSQDDSMQVDVNGKNNIYHGPDGPPLLLTQFGDVEMLPAALSHPKIEEEFAQAAEWGMRHPLFNPILQHCPDLLLAASSHQSDEELAKKLAAEWGSLPDEGEICTKSMNSTVDRVMKSDEDYARELQALWDAEVTAAGHPFTGGSDSIDLTSQVATTDDVGTLESDDDDHLAGLGLLPIPTVPNLENSEKSSSTATSTTVASGGTTATTATSSNDETTDNNQDKLRRNPLEFEKHGHTFSLFHYNGLHGGTLTQFRLTRLSPTEAVGASIALSSNGSSAHGAGGCDLEGVVRTKWPSSMINWLGKNPPSID